MDIIVSPQINQLDQEQWNQLAGDYPFTRYEFLSCLEESGAVSADTGWQPTHVVFSENDQYVAALPLYLKSHSYGEYVFDWGWANAYEQNGRRYYPKLLTAVPFSPCTGPRLLSHDNNEVFWPRVVSVIKTLVDRYHASGWHCLFPEDANTNYIPEDCDLRRGVQFHWKNYQYQSFDDFLGRFSSRKRKNLIKERQQIRDLNIYWLEGEDIKPVHWRQFYKLYRNTYLKRSGHDGYLEEKFFQLLGKAMPEHCLLNIAEDGGEVIAGAFYLKDKETLFGRYWGCHEEIPGLHFECCYYQGIEYAIEKGLKRFDAGAQGEHKIPRGFEPTATWSWHWLKSPEFRQAIKNFLEQEAVDVKLYQEECATSLPFKKAE